MTREVTLNTFKSSHLTQKLLNYSARTKGALVMTLRRVILNHTFFLHQVFQGLPFHVVGNVADKDAVSFVHVSIGLVTSAPASLLRPLFPVRVRLMLEFPVHLSAGRLRQKAAVSTR